MLEALYQWITYQVTTNDVFAGVMGLSLFGSLAYYLRDIPNYLYRLALRNFTVEMTVHNTESTMFYCLSMWLSKQTYTKRTRRLQLKGGNYYDQDYETGVERKDYRLVPGAGRHWFFYGGSLIVLTHSVEEKDSGRGSFLRESYIIRMTGRRQEVMRKLIDEALALIEKKNTVGVNIWGGGHWEEFTQKQPRPLESIVLPDNQVIDIVKDAEWFFGASNWYIQRGIPYRRGYLFHGMPGTGKTSMVMALASYFKRPLYVINLGSVASDESLMAAFRDIDENAIVLIEDIDIASVSGKRTKRAVAGGGKEKMLGISLSGLLNSIDGVATADGRLLIMTTNHPDKLDPALIRPGRIDRKELFGPIGLTEASIMFRRFFPDALEGDFIDGLSLPMPAADVQAKLIEYNGGLNGNSEDKS